MKVLATLLTILTLWGCNNKTTKGENINTSYTIKTDSILKLPIDVSDYFSWYSETLETDSTTYLFRENGMVSEIQIFDLKKIGNPKKIQFQTEGTNGIGAAVGMSIIPLALDSFYITNRRNELLLMKNDSIIKKYDLSSNKTYPSMVPQNNAKTIRFNDSLFGFLQYKQIHINSNEYLKSSAFAIYDIKNLIFKDASVSFPNSYLNKCWGPQMLNPAYTFNPKTGKVIFSFPSEKNLYIYDFKTDSVNEIEVGYTRYFKKVEPYTDCEEEPKKIDSYFLNTPNYFTIAYDTYRDIYYRLFFLPQKEVHKGMRGSLIHKRVGLTIYNNNFEKLYETLFDPYEFYPTDYFITEEGLWLSKNNPENPYFDESYFQFALLNLKENE